MARLLRRQGFYALSIFFAAAPFAFGLLRAFKAGADLRLLWMAFASLAGAAVAMAIGKARNRTADGIFARSATVFIFATLLAGATGYMLGARSAPGIWGVAVVLAACWAASYAFGMLARSDSGSHP